ncbi:TPA: hypothetical protein L5621_006269 [Pseudomonas aeruginosa]|nr:hypothetical protein [Pseudomonas aeruginosa]
MFAHQGVEALSRIDAALDDLLHQVLLELPVLSPEIIALVSRQNTRSVLRIDAHMFSRRLEPVLLVDVFLEGFEVRLILFIDTNRIRLSVRQKIMLGNNDVNMWLTCDEFTGLFILDLLHPGQMSFGIKIKLIAFIGIHHELLEFIGNRRQLFIGNLIFSEREREGEIAVLPIILNRLVNFFGKAQVAVKDYPLVQFVPCVLAPGFLSLFKIFFCTVVIAANPNQHHPLPTKADHE